MTKSKLNDAIVVADVECTCWEPDAPQPRWEHQEIIQVGVCELFVEHLTRGEKCSYLCKPEQSEITEFCTNLTGITEERMDAGGIPLAYTLPLLRDRHSTRRRTWASYGDFDRHQFKRECERKGLDYPFGRRHINVKTLFALAHGLEKEVPMDKALEMLKVPLVGRHHDGMDDAYNVAGILCHVLSIFRCGWGLPPSQEG